MIGAYALASALVHNPVLLPPPGQILSFFLNLFTESSFYASVMTTTGRVLLGTLISMICALVLSVLSNEFPSFGRYFEPIHVLSKTIPNISYIIIALIWLGSEGAVMLVAFLILFPVYYNSFTQTMTAEEPVLKQVQILYKESFFRKLKVKTLPMLVPAILETSKTAMSLGFKVGIMAEILGSVQKGIGREINFCRFDLNTAGIFAWTIVIIIISVVISSLFTLALQKFMQYR
jgi:NitT/TauT family transport system permease protein